MGEKEKAFTYASIQLKVEADRREYLKLKK